jgi:hypothetical protein
VHDLLAGQIGWSMAMGEVIRSPSTVPPREKQRLWLAPAIIVLPRHKLWWGRCGRVARSIAAGASVEALSECDVEPSAQGLWRRHSAPHHGAVARHLLLVQAAQIVPHNSRADDH